MCCNFRIKVLKEAEAHLVLATQERSYYKSLVDASKRVLQQSFTVDGELKLSPGTHNITMHYSFDMAQQVSMDINCFIHATYQLHNHRSITHPIHSSQDLCTS